MSPETIATAIQNDVQAAGVLASIVGLVIAASRIGPGDARGRGDRGSGDPPAQLPATRYDRCISMRASLSAWCSLQTVLLELRLVITLVARVKIGRDRLTTLPDPQRRCDRRPASSGSGSFSLRLTAAVAIPLLSLLLAFGHAGGTGAADVMRFVVMVAVVVTGVIALVMLGLGAVTAAQAGVLDLDGTPLLVGGALAAWCAGVMLQQLQQVHDALHGLRTLRERDGDQAFSIALPVIVAITAPCVAASRFTAMFHPVREPAQDVCRSDEAGDAETA